MMTGISRPQNASRKAAHLSLPVHLACAGLIFFFFASIITTTMRARPIRTPGMMPAINMLPTSVPTIDA